MTFLVTLFALLSPLDQSITEIERILKDPHLKRYIQTSERIDKILRREKGYLILTDRHQLIVEVIYNPENLIGPKGFTLVFHPPENHENGDRSLID